MFEFIRILAFVVSIVMICVFFYSFYGVLKFVIQKSYRDMYDYTLILIYVVFTVMIIVACVDDINNGGVELLWMDLSSH